MTHPRSPLCRWIRGVWLSGLLACGFPSFRAQAATIFDQDTTWRYWKGWSEASTPDVTAWRGLGFDDAGWLTADAPFFYEDSAGFVGNTVLADMRGGYSCLFLRKNFRFESPFLPPELGLDVWADDGCVVWINGIEVLRVNVPDGHIPFNGASLAAAGEPNVAGTRILNAADLLRSGDNVIAVQALNSSIADSSDFLVAARLTADADVVAPVVAETVPWGGARVRSLNTAEVIFSESVQGVDAADLIVNGVSATNVVVYSPRDYQFGFPTVAAGAVTLDWAPGHGITDLAAPPNPFEGGSWSCTVDPTVPPVTLLLTEFLGSNDRGIRDDDGDRSDWIEIHNPSEDAVSLAGWSLTDDASNLAQWRFPAVTLPRRGYLLVWASGKNRTGIGTPLHTSFRLSDGGEYLALVDPETNVVSAFAPVYPVQRPDISYGRDAADPSVVGYFPTPSPGAPNVPGGPGFAPEPAFSMPGGVYTNHTLTVQLSAPSGEIRYTLDGTVPTGSSWLYTGPLVLTVSGVVQARVFETGLLPGGIGVRSYDLVGAGLSEFYSNLPLMVINTHGRGIPMDHRLTNVTVTTFESVRGRTQLTPPPAHQSLAQIEVRGQTSSGFPKQPYNLELNDPYHNDLEAPLLGLPAESDWVLHNPYSDKSLLNDCLAFELHERMGHYAVRRRFVELFVDQTGGRLEYPQDYMGVYVLLEKIKVDGNRVDLARLAPEHQSEPEISGGYIFKKDKNSPGDLDFSTQGGAGFAAQWLKIHEPKPREITAGATRLDPGLSDRV